MIDWFDADRQGRTVLSRDLDLIWCNPAARTLMERRQGLLLRHGVVRTTNLRNQIPFAEFVRNAGERPSVLCLPEEDGGAHLLLTAVRLPRTKLVGATASRVCSGSGAIWADLSEAFGLTPCEQEICQSLGSGLTADAVARKLRTSVKTVRTHIRHVYSKLDVSSREGLFHKLRPFMIVE